MRINVEKIMKNKQEMKRIRWITGIGGAEKRAGVQRGGGGVVENEKNKI